MRWRGICLRNEAIWLAERVCDLFWLNSVGIFLGWRMINAIEGGFEERRVARSVRFRIIIREGLVAEGSREFREGVHLRREAFHPSFTIISNQLNYKQP